MPILLTCKSVLLCKNCQSNDKSMREMMKDFIPASLRSNGHCDFQIWTQNTSTKIVHKGKLFRSIFLDFCRISVSQQQSTALQILWGDKWLDFATRSNHCPCLPGVGPYFIILTLDGVALSYWTGVLTASFLNRILYLNKKFIFHFIKQYILSTGIVAWRCTSI